MRLRTYAALTTVVFVVLAQALPASAQSRRSPSKVTERITIIDETGRRTTKVTVRPRSYLDPGREILPDSQHYTNYATPPNYSYFYDRNDWKGSWSRMPLPGPFDIPGYRDY